MTTQRLDPDGADVPGEAQPETGRSEAGGVAGAIAGTGFAGPLGGLEGAMAGEVAGATIDEDDDAREADPEHDSAKPTEGD